MFVCRFQRAEGRTAIIILKYSMLCGAKKTNAIEQRRNVRTHSGRFARGKDLQYHSIPIVVGSTEACLLTMRDGASSK